MPIRELFQRRRRRLLKGLALAASTSLLVALGSLLGYFEGFEAVALDRLLRLRGRIRSPEIMLVKIDEVAFRNLGERQPISRDYLAGLITVLAKSGATVIGLDVELQVATDPREDDLIVRAIDGAASEGVSRVVTIYTIRPGTTVNGKQTYVPSSPFTHKLQTVAGFANALVDQDSLIRRVPLAVRDERGHFQPSFALAMLARHAGYDPPRLRACFSGGAGGRTFRAKGLSMRTGPLTDKFLQDLIQKEGRMILTASDVNQVSHEDPALGHGIFAHYLLEALSGAGDLDGDGALTVREIHLYLERRVHEHSGGNQTPQLYSIGDMVIVRVK